MAKSDILSTVTTRIAAATSTTPADELAILKVLGTKLGLDISNIVTQANTASNTASSKDLTDVILLNQALDDYSSKSYVGEIRPMSSLLPNKITYEDGSDWIKQGFYETDSTKVKEEVFPYGVIGNAVDDTGLSLFTPANNTIVGATVRLNSGKHVSFGYGGHSAPITCFNDPAVVGVQLNAGVNICDYSYDSVNDILYLLASGSTLFKITNDGTTITSITNTNYGLSDTSARSVLARNGVVYVGGSGKIRKSTDGGSSWSDNIFTGITFSHHVHRMGYVESENKLVVFAKNGSTLPSRTTSETFDILYSVNDAAFVLINTFTIDGFPHAVVNYKDNLLVIHDYTNGTTSKHMLYCIYVGLNTYTYIYESASIVGSSGYRPNIILSKNKDFVIMGSQTTSITYWITAFNLDNRIFNVIMQYSSSKYIPVDTNTGIGRSSITLFNECLYLRTQNTGTYKKLPLYGIIGTNTPHSFLRIK